MCNINHQMYTFQIIVLIQFLASTKCSNIMCSSPGRPFVHVVLYGMFSIHMCMQSSRWKDVLNTSLHLLVSLHECQKNIPYKTACTNGLPDDGQMMFEHLVDAKNWIKTIIWKAYICWFMLHNCITMYSTKTKLNSVALVRERTIPTERPPPVGEGSANFLRVEGCHVVSATSPHGR